MDWLGDNVWFGHAIHVDDDEIGQLARCGCGVSHCSSSNMRLASGIAPVKKYMAAGVKVGYGVDGSASNDSSNMMLEVRTGFLLARVKMGLLPPEGPAKYMNLSQSHPKRAMEWMTAREALEIATLGGAKVLGRDDIGSLEIGKCADFFSIDLNTVDFAGALHDPGGSDRLLRSTEGQTHDHQRARDRPRRPVRHGGPCQDRGGTQPPQPGTRQHGCLIIFQSPKTLKPFLHPPGA